MVTSAALALLTQLDSFWSALRSACRQLGLGRAAPLEQAAPLARPHLPALAQQHSLFAAAVEQISTGVMICDARHADHPLVFVNQAFTAITGYAPEEVLGKNCRFLQGPETDRATLEAIRVAMAEGRTFRGVIRNYRADGRPFWNGLTISPVVDHGGAPIYYVGLQNDMTPRIDAGHAVERRDAILAAVRHTAAAFLRAADWRQALPEALRRLAESAGLSRAFAYRRLAPDQIQLLAAWSDPARPPPPALAEILPGLPGELLLCWGAALDRGEPIACSLEGASAHEQALLARLGVRALALVPVMVGGCCWGVLGFSDQRAEQVGAGAVTDALRATAELVAAVVERGEAEADLQRAHADLELRVRERTAELAETNSQLSMAVLELRRSQAALAASEAQTRALLRAIPDAIVRLRQDGTILGGKPSSNRWLLLGDDAAIGRRIEEVAPERFADQLRPALYAAIGGGRPVIFEFRPSGRLGEHLITSGLISPPQLAAALGRQQGPGRRRLGEILLADGLISAPELEAALLRQQDDDERRDFEVRVVPSGDDQCIVIIRDITDRRRAEERLRQQVAHAAARLDLANALAAARLDYPRALETVVRHMAAIFDAFCFIHLVSDDGASFTLHSWFHPLAALREWLYPRVLTTTQPVTAGPLGEVIRSGQQRAFGGPPHQPADLGQAGIPLRGAFLTPLRAHGRTLGVLTLARPEDAAGLLAVDAALVQELADRAALTLENARLYHLAQQEIVERTRAEARVRASEERYRTLVETLPDGIALIDRQGTILFSNKILPEICAVELLGRSDRLTLADLVVESDRQRLPAIAFPRGSPRAPLDLEVTMLRPDGSPFPAELHVRPIPHAESPRQGAIVVVRDISARTLMQADLDSAYNDLMVLNIELQRSRDLLQTLFDGLEDGLVLLDRDRSVLALNQAITRMLQLSPEALLGRDWSAITALPPALIAATFRQGAPQRHQTRLAATGGQNMIYNLQTLPLFSGDQDVERVIVRLEDVTERLQMEARLLEHERFAASGRLAATVAHEINTPLQSIQALLYLIETETGDQRAGYLELAQQEIGRIARIVHQLLDMYRPGAQAVMPINLNQLVDRALLLVDQFLAKQRIQVSHDLAPELPLVRGRQDQLTQVLLNLLINGVEAMELGGRIQVRTFAAPAPPRPDGLPEVVLEIEDNGPGIPEEMRGRIFEPFYTTKAAGTGIGLAICARIVAEHSGAITVRSAAGGGSVFAIRLPEDRA